MLFNSEYWSTHFDLTHLLLANNELYPNLKYKLDNSVNMRHTYTFFSLPTDKPLYLFGAPNSGHLYALRTQSQCLLYKFYTTCE